MRDLHVARAVWNTPWFITPDKLSAICRVVSRHLAGERLSDEERAASAAAAASQPQPSTDGAVAILPLFGTIAYRMDLMMAMSGGTSLERFMAAFRQSLADTTVKAILIDGDTPGGGVEGVDEASKEIFQARGVKPIVAIADPMLASAGYYLASAADEVVIMPTGTIGSIGVVVEHLDDSEAMQKAGLTSTVIAQPEYKAELWGPLTDEARARLETVVGQYYAMFKKAVARNRGISVADVEKKYGEVGPGRVLMAQEALACGMVDRIATREETIRRLAGRGGSVISVRTEASEAAMQMTARASELQAAAAAPVVGWTDPPQSDNGREQPAAPAAEEAALEIVPAQTAEASEATEPAVESPATDQAGLDFLEALG